MDTTNLRISEPHLDWASLTVQASPERIVDGLRRKVQGAWSIKRVQPKNRGYTAAYEILNVSRESLCTVECGAPHGWNLVNATGTQPNSEVRDAVRWIASQGVAARATRLDSAIDIFGGDFDQLAGLVENTARMPKNGAPVRSFERFEGTHGRTLYVGSRKGSVRVRLYEKGWEQRGKGNESAPLDWVRLELQWRPSDTLRTSALDFAPDEIWGASAWTAEIAQQLLNRDVMHASVPHELTDFEQSYEWLCRSAAGIFNRAVEQFGVRAVVHDLTGQALEDLPQLPKL